MYTSHLKLALCKCHSAGQGQVWSSRDLPPKVDWRWCWSDHHYWQEGEGWSRQRPPQETHQGPGKHTSPTVYYFPTCKTPIVGLCQNAPPLGTHTAEDEIRYKKCMDNLSKHNPFCSAILHFWSAINNLISANLHVHPHECVPQNCNAMCEAWVRGYHMAILLANVRCDILLWREVSQRPPVNSQSSKRKWSTEIKRTRNGWGNMIASAWR